MWSGVHSILIIPVSVASRRATGWTAGVDSRQGEDVPLLHIVQTGSGATQPPIQWVPGVKRPRREADIRPELQKDKVAKSMHA
jgi:hypothetical protein